MSARVQALVLASVQKILGWPEWRSLPGASGAGSWSEEQKRAIVEPRLRGARSSPMLPGVRRFAPGKSMAAGRSYAAPATGSQVVISVMNHGGNGCGAPDLAPAIEVEFAGAPRVHLWHRR